MILDQYAKFWREQLVIMQIYDQWKEQVPEKWHNLSLISCYASGVCFVDLGLGKP